MKWEYKVTRDASGPSISSSQHDLNLAGRDGWELVSIMKEAEKTGSSLVMIFKRPDTKLPGSDKKYGPGLVTTSKPPDSN